MRLLCACVNVYLWCSTDGHVHTKPQRCCGTIWSLPQHQPVSYNIDNTNVNTLWNFTKMNSVSGTLHKQSPTRHTRVESFCLVHTFSIHFVRVGMKLWEDGKAFACSDEDCIMLWGGTSLTECKDPCYSFGPSSQSNAHLVGCCLGS